MKFKTRWRHDKIEDCWARGAWGQRDLGRSGKGRSTHAARASRRFYARLLFAPGWPAPHLLASRASYQEGGRPRQRRCAKLASHHALRPAGERSRPELGSGGGDVDAGEEAPDAGLQAPSAGPARRHQRRAVRQQYHALERRHIRVIRPPISVMLG